MENDILDSLNDLGYEGPLADEDAFSKALDAGPKSLEYTKLIHILAEELKKLCNLEETVNMMNDPDESSSFLLELSSFLKELGCPYKKLTTGHMSSRLQTREDRILLLDYLVSELMGARMVNVDCPKEKSGAGMEIVVQESPTAKDLKDVLIALKFNKPPPNITIEMLFSKLEAKLKETIQKQGEQLVGKPLYNKALTEKEWKQLEATFSMLFEEYRGRREMLITRLECTIQSFEWSERLKSKKDVIQSTYRPKHEQLKVKPDVKLSDFLAARSSLLQVEKTSSATVRKNTQTDVNKVIIGQVPDRGGRPNEQQPPPPEMPSWQQRTAPGGRGGRGGGGRGGPSMGGDRGGGRAGPVGPGGRVQGGYNRGRGDQGRPAASPANFNQNQNRNYQTYEVPPGGYNQGYGNQNNQVYQNQAGYGQGYQNQGHNNQGYGGYNQGYDNQGGYAQGQNQGESLPEKSIVSVDKDNVSNVEDVSIVDLEKEGVVDGKQSKINLDLGEDGLKLVDNQTSTDIAHKERQENCSMNVDHAISSDLDNKVSIDSGNVSALKTVDVMVQESSKKQDNSPINVEQAISSDVENKVSIDTGNVSAHYIVDVEEQENLKQSEISLTSKNETCSNAAFDFTLDREIEGNNFEIQRADDYDVHNVAFTENNILEESSTQPDSEESQTKKEKAVAETAVKEDIDVMEVAVNVYPIVDLTADSDDELTSNKITSSTNKGGDQNAQSKLSSADEIFVNSQLKEIKYRNAAKTFIVGGFGKHEAVRLSRMEPKDMIASVQKDPDKLRTVVNYLKSDTFKSSPPIPTLSRKNELSSDDTTFVNLHFKVRKDRKSAMNFIKAGFSKHEAVHLTRLEPEKMILSVEKDPEKLRTVIDFLACRPLSLDCMKLVMKHKANLNNLQISTEDGKKVRKYEGRKVRIHPLTWDEMETVRLWLIREIALTDYRPAVTKWFYNTEWSSLDVDCFNKSAANWVVAKIIKGNRQPSFPSGLTVDSIIFEEIGKADSKAQTYSIQLDEADASKETGKVDSKVETTSIEINSTDTNDKQPEIKIVTESADETVNESTSANQNPDETHNDSQLVKTSVSLTNSVSKSGTLETNVTLTSTVTFQNQNLESTQVKQGRKKRKRTGMKRIRLVPKKYRNDDNKNLYYKKPHKEGMAGKKEESIENQKQANIVKTEEPVNIPITEDIKTQPTLKVEDVHVETPKPKRSPRPSINFAVKKAINSTLSIINTSLREDRLTKAQRRRLERRKCRLDIKLEEINSVSQTQPGLSQENSQGSVSHTAIEQSERTMAPIKIPQQSQIPVTHSLVPKPVPMTNFAKLYQKQDQTSILHSQTTNQGQSSTSAMLQSNQIVPLGIPRNKTTNKRVYPTVARGQRPSLVTLTPEEIANKKMRLNPVAVQNQTLPLASLYPVQRPIILVPTLNIGGQMPVPALSTPVFDQLKRSIQLTPRSITTSINTPFPLRQINPTLMSTSFQQPDGSQRSIPARFNQMHRQRPISDQNFTQFDTNPLPQRQINANRVSTSLQQSDRGQGSIPGEFEQRSTQFDTNPLPQRQMNTSRVSTSFQKPDRSQMSIPAEFNQMQRQKPVFDRNVTQFNTNPLPQRQMNANRVSTLLQQSDTTALPQREKSKSGVFDQRFTQLDTNPLPQRQRSNPRVFHQSTTRFDTNPLPQRVRNENRVSTSFQQTDRGQRSIPAGFDETLRSTAVFDHRSTQFDTSPLPQRQRNVNRRSDEDESSLSAVFNFDPTASERFIPMPESDELPGSMTTQHEPISTQHHPSTSRRAEQYPPSTSTSQPKDFESLKQRFERFKRHL